MIFGCALLTANDAITKWLTQDYPVTQVWGLRTIFILIPILVLAPRYGGYRALLPTRVSLQLIHGVLFVAGTLLIISGLSLLPLAQMVAVAFSSPIIVAALAPLLLGERVNTIRWFAIGVGFVGVLAILRPDPETLGIASLVAFTAAFVSALRDIAVRRISSSESSLSILFFSSAMVVVVALTLSPWLGWERVDLLGWGLLIVAGIFNGGAQFLIIQALRLGQASIVAPYKFSALIWGALLGFVVWGDIPTLLAVVGTVLIVISGIVILHQSQQV